jgi:hypothetical protein
MASLYFHYVWKGLEFPIISGVVLWKCKCPTLVSMKSNFVALKVEILTLSLFRPSATSRTATLWYCGQLSFPKTVHPRPPSVVLVSLKVPCHCLCSMQAFHGLHILEEIQNCQWGTGEGWTRQCRCLLSKAPMAIFIFLCLLCYVIAGVFVEKKVKWRELNFQELLLGYDQRSTNRCSTTLSSLWNKRILFNGDVGGPSLVYVSASLLEFH